MIEHKVAQRLVMLIVVVSIALCIGGWIHGHIIEGYEELKNNDKIEAVIIDELIDKGEAEVVIMLKQQENAEGIRSIQSDVLSSNPDFEVGYKYSQISAMSGTLDKETLEYLIADENVEKIYLDKKLKINLYESIPLIKGDYVNNVTRNKINLKGKYYTSCVIDTGVDYTHPALAGRVISGWDYYNNDSDYMDDNSHGTHVAGIIASNDSTYRGVAPEANIVAIKVCSADGQSCPTSKVIAGIDWCVANASDLNISVISMSLGDDGEYNSTNCPNTMDTSINNAVANNIFVVSSSGNTGHTKGISYPACSPNVTSVGATDKSDNIGEEGSWRTNVGELLDILAPGETIYSSVPGGIFGDKSGTSLAAPHVSGAALLLIQNKGLRGVTLTPSEIRTQLKVSSHNISDSGYVFPRLSLKESILDNSLVLSYEINPYPKTNANIYFYANYTNKTSNTSVTDAICKVNFNDSLNNIMTWNVSHSAYQYIRNFTAIATYSYNVTCNHTDHETLTEESSIQVVQGSENCTYPGNNGDWNITGSNFSRCIGEILTINQSNIRVRDNAEFYLKDTNITLIEANADYVINVTDNGNLTFDNVYVKGYSSSYTLDVESQGYVNIYNSTFENSRVRIYGSNSNTIEDSTFKDEVYTYGTALTDIEDSDFEDYAYFKDNSTTSLINSGFDNFIYLQNYARVKTDNMTAQDWLFLEDNSILNASEFTNLSTSSFSVENNPTIYGEIDMPTTTNVFPGINATRYFPVYVYYNDGTTPYPNKEVTIINSTGFVLFNGTTNSQGYIEISNSFGDSNYAVGSFNVSANPTEGLYLFMDSPIRLQTSTAPPTPPSSGGGSSTTIVETCEEDWLCQAWGGCIDDVQRRTCGDLNSCGTIMDRPPLIRGCGESSLGRARDAGLGDVYHIHDDSIDLKNNKRICCLWGICAIWYGLCWYWWVVIIFVIVNCFVVLWRLDVEKRKRKRHAIAKILEHHSMHHHSAHHRVHHKYHR